jgi:hypothetical protein
MGPVVNTLTTAPRQKRRKGHLNRVSRLLLAAVAGVICQAQTQVNLQTQTKNVDFSQAVEVANDKRIVNPGNAAPGNYQGEED